MARHCQVTHYDAPTYNSEIERLCGYLKNDSLIRWSLGCSQEEIDRTRERLAKQPRRGYGSLPRSAQSDDMAEENLRLSRAAAGNHAYLKAIARAQR